VSHCIGIELLRILTTIALSSSNDVSEFEQMLYVFPATPCFASTSKADATSLTSRKSLVACGARRETKESDIRNLPAMSRQTRPLGSPGPVILKIRPTTRGIPKRVSNDRASID